ncbi:MAG TPA: NUDIX hydrolase [Terriglobales bacterium]|nr:NUDIX hydrolase [Terriglobales bacterium]
MRRDYPDRPFLGVGAIVIHDNRVLLVRRANPPLQGEWSIPGGLVETGETTRDAIVREVLEETALRVEVAALVEVFERILRDNQSRVQYHYVLLDYRCCVASGEAYAGSDVSEVRWVTLDELELLSVAPETCAVIRKAVDSAANKSEL